MNGSGPFHDLSCKVQSRLDQTWTPHRRVLESYYQGGSEILTYGVPWWNSHASTIFGMCTGAEACLPGLSPCGHTANIIVHKITDNTWCAPTATKYMPESTKSIVFFILDEFFSEKNLQKCQQGWQFSAYKLNSVCYLYFLYWPIIKVLQNGIFWIVALRAFSPCVTSW